MGKKGLLEQPGNVTVTANSFGGKMSYQGLQAPLPDS